MNLFSFFYPDVQMSAKQEKNHKKILSDSLSVLQNFAGITFFFFPPSEK